MGPLFETGRIVDLILLLTLAEGLALCLLYAAKGRGLRPLRVGLMLLPGIFLLLALRFALTDAWWGLIAGALLAALLAHLGDLALRMRR